MPQPHAGPLSAAAAAATTKRSKGGSFFRTCRRGVRHARRIPSFIYILAIYVVMLLTVADMRAPFYTIASYSIAWVEVLYIMGFLSAITGLRQVVRPGDDNTNAALAMTAVLGIYIVLFALGAAGIPMLTLFATSEFLVLIVVSLIQVVMAFRINSATLQRTIGSTGADGHGHDDYNDD